MKGDFDKCQIGDFILYQTDISSYDWQNDVYLIIDKKENGRLMCIRMNLRTLNDIHNKNEYLCTTCFNVESEYCTLITRKDIETKYIQQYKQ